MDPQEILRLAQAAGLTGGLAGGNTDDAVLALAEQVWRGALADAAAACERMAAACHPDHWQDAQVHRADAAAIRRLAQAGWPGGPCR